MAETIYYMDTDQGNDIPVPASKVGGGLPTEPFNVVFKTFNSYNDLIERPDECEFTCDKTFAEAAAAAESGKLLRGFIELAYQDEEEPSVWAGPFNVLAVTNSGASFGTVMPAVVENNELSLLAMYIGILPNGPVVYWAAFSKNISTGENS